MRQIDSAFYNIDASPRHEGYKDAEIIKSLLCISDELVVRVFGRRPNRLKGKKEYLTATDHVACLSIVVD
jgi:hypothetical protein